jgi:hypothetical protein
MHTLPGVSYVFSFDGHSLVVRLADWSPEITGSAPPQPPGSSLCRLKGTKVPQRKPYYYSTMRWGNQTFFDATMLFF